MIISYQPNLDREIHNERERCIIIYFCELNKCFTTIYLAIIFPIFVYLSNGPEKNISLLEFFVVKLLYFKNLYMCI